MSAENSNIIIAEEIIISKIYRVRGKQVMLSQDLAELYHVETKVLNQQVKRNIGKVTHSNCVAVLHERNPPSATTHTNLPLAVNL